MRIRKCPQSVLRLINFYVGNLIVEAAKISRNKSVFLIFFCNSNSDTEQLKELSLAHLLIDRRKKKIISYGASTYFLNKILFFDWRWDFKRQFSNFLTLKDLFF